MIPIGEIKNIQIGDYVILKEIGQGMLGTIFLCKHRFLKKHYILKVFRELYTQDIHFLQRFEKEIFRFSMLDHPNIIKMHNVGSDDGKFFIVSELFINSDAEILDVNGLLQDKKFLSEEETFSIAKQVACALDYAHQMNIDDEPLAHRGLKLSNILVKRSLQEIEVKISDFGLSRITGIEQLLMQTHEALWKTRFVKESPSSIHHSFLQYYAFLAPEQRGEVETTCDQDVKGDVYSFGVLLYYLLTGVFPEGFFPMPSEIKNVQKEWDHIIQQCLSLDPEKRPLLLSPLFTDFLKKEKNERRPLIKPQEIVRPAYEPDPAAVFQIDKTVAIYTPEHSEIIETKPLLTEMIVIEGGTFLRGSNHGGRDEMPRHAINLSSFAVDIHPVTNEQFVRFLETMGGEKDGQNNDTIRLRDSRIKRIGRKLIIESGYAKHPVVGVTWYGAKAYAKWVGKRLPTEAEWEVAACGGLEGALYPTGEEMERSQANFFSSDTTSVMSYPPNNYGLYDVAGNVYEWCEDWYGYHYYDVSLQEPDDPKGPPQGVYRVLRGGCWKSLKEDMRCSHRHRNNPGVMNGTYGFRCTADLTA